MIHQILAELNESNSTNHKLTVLKKYKNDTFLQRVLKMSYDKVAFTYGVSVEQIAKFAPNETGEKCNLAYALNAIENYLCTRELTGHAALQTCSDLIFQMSDEDADVFKKVINRDLRINAGKTLVNKVWPGLITKPCYMRCDVYSKKTAKNVKFPAILQLKADGTYREFAVENNKVEARSRSGESYEYPLLFETLKHYPDGVYTGELTVRGISDRSKGNGLINSDDPPHEDIVLDLWDYICLDEYSNATKKDKKSPNVTKYSDRFELLKKIVSANDANDNVRVIDSHEVNSLKEALEITSKYMSSGYEGAILKNKDGVFKDGTSKDQLKLKLEIDCEMRVKGFNPGSPGTKREGKVGSLIYENDEGTIKGKCSGFSDDELDDMTLHPEKYLEKIFTIQFNDLTKAENNDYYALSHPRFIEIRNDKTETDTLETVLKLREMAMELGA